MFLPTTVCILGLFATVYGAGEMTILQSPDSIVFSGKEELDLSTVKNVLSTALGFSIPETQRWSGMTVKDPFRFAEVVVVVGVGGAWRVGESALQQGRIYPLHTDQPLHDTLDSLRWRISERFPTQDNLTLVEVNLDNPKEAEKYFGDLTIRDSPALEYLKVSVPEDKAFLDQIMVMDAITGKVSSIGIKSDGVPDLYWFDLPGLHALIDTYGEDSKPVAEAKRLFSSSVLLLSDVFSTVYDDKVVFVTLASDVIHTRRYRRQTNESDYESVGATLADQKEQPDNYAAIFNIFLWFGVAFVFALLAVSIGIADMDPGRDSIIYRMTSNRMKKDN